MFANEQDRLRKLLEDGFLVKFNTLWRLDLGTENNKLKNVFKVFDASSDSMVSIISVILHPFFNIIFGALVAFISTRMLSSTRFFVLLNKVQMVSITLVRIFALLLIRVGSSSVKLQSIVNVINSSHFVHAHLVFSDAITLDDDFLEEVYQLIKHDHLQKGQGH